MLRLMVHRRWSICQYFSTLTCVPPDCLQQHVKLSSVISRSASLFWTLLVPDPSVCSCLWTILVYLLWIL